MTVPILANELLGGAERNNLNSVLHIDSRTDEQTETFAPSDYYDIDSVYESM